MQVYPIVDVDVCASKGVVPAKLATWLHRAGVKLLQLRAKGWNDEELLGLAREVQRDVPSSECRLVINDRVDVAARARTWGVHVGQTDLPVATARAMAPDVAVGISTHSLAQVNSALRTRPDYVALGPVFTTASKRNPEPTVGLDVLKGAWEACERANIPLVAIGGITHSNVHLVRPFCTHVAVIGAVTHGDEASVRDAVVALAQTT